MAIHTQRLSRAGRHSCTNPYQRRHTPWYPLKVIKRESRKFDASASYCPWRMPKADPPGRGHEQQKRRPCVVGSPDAMHQTDMAVICTVSDRIRALEPRETKTGRR